MITRRAKFGRFVCVGAGLFGVWSLGASFQGLLGGGGWVANICSLLKIIRIKDAWVAQSIKRPDF